jgi:hypothetical protein
MATKSTALTDPELQARLEEAYQKLNESLDERKNRFFDPAYLAAAQAFATPTKTGSAFEALGNVAGAIGKAENEEAKREFDLNKAKFDINKELLAINQQRRMQDSIAEEVAAAQQGQAPAAPTAGALPGPQQPEGAATTSATLGRPLSGISAGPLITEPQGNLPPLNPVRVAAAESRPDLVTKPVPPPAPPPAAPPAAHPAPPAAAAIPTSPLSQLSPAGLRIFRLANSQGASYADAIKAGREHDAALEQQRINREKLTVDQEQARIAREKLGLEQQDIEIRRGSLANAVESTAQGNYKVVGKALVDIRDGKTVYIDGSPEVIIDGKSYSVNPAQGSAFANAQNKGDTATVERLGKEIMGLTGKPGALRVLSNEEKERIKLEEAKTREVEKSVAIEKLKDEEKRQRELVNKIPKFEAQRDNATTAIQILGDKDVQKALGPLAGPGLAKAVGTIISGGVRVGSYNVALANFDEALINIKASPETRVKIDALRSAVRTEELINAQTYLKGDGPITNMERGLVQEIGGMVNKDPAAALLFKIQLSYAQAAVNERYARSFEAWHDKNPTGTVADFNRSSTYQKIRSDYLGDLESVRKDIGVVPATAAPENKSTMTKLRELVKSTANKVTP